MPIPCLFFAYRQDTGIQSADPAVYLSAKGRGNCSYSRNAFARSKLASVCASFNTVPVKEAGWLAILRSDVHANTTAPPLAIAAGRWCERFISLLLAWLIEGSISWRVFFCKAREGPGRVFFPCLLQDVFSPILQRLPQTKSHTSSTLSGCTWCATRSLRQRHSSTQIWMVFCTRPILLVPAKHSSMTSRLAKELL